MQYRNLGASGLKVSTLCLGTMTFGEANESSFMHGTGCDEATSHKILHHALDAGINFIDTADVYGQEGLSERVIGNFFASSGRRDDVVLASKFRFRMGPGPNGTGASRGRIMKCVEDSLRRLRTDRIDLYQVHMQDIEAPEEETLRALDDLVRQGKVVHLGASNYAAYRLVDSLWTSKAAHLERFVALQMQYSLLVRDIEREHIPLATQWNLGVIPWSPLAAGALSGKYRRGQAPPASSRFAADKWKAKFAGLDNERTWKVIEALVTVAERVGATAPQVALAWLLAKPAVSSVIFGARSIPQLDENLPAAELKLPADIQKTLDDASELDPGYPYTMIRGIQGRW